MRKTFHGRDAVDLQEMAQGEYARLERFHDALGGVPGAVCPRPLEVVAGPEPFIRMERSRGEPLLRVLRARHLAPAVVRQLAQTSVTALSAYVLELGEPYFDFQFDNMLYDEESGVLTFLDLGLPDHEHVTPLSASPLEVSLGNLVGSTMLQSARPRFLTATLQHRQAIPLCEAIVTLAAGSAAVSPDRLRLLARAAYARSAFTGDRLQAAWYASVGYVVARRPRVLDLVVGPPLPWAHSQDLSTGSEPRSVWGETNMK